MVVVSLYSYTVLSRLSSKTVSPNDFLKGKFCQTVLFIYEYSDFVQCFLEGKAISDCRGENTPKAAKINQRRLMLHALSSL